MCNDFWQPAHTYCRSLLSGTSTQLSSSPRATVVQQTLRDTCQDKSHWLWGRNSHPQRFGELHLWFTVSEQVSYPFWHTDTSISSFRPSASQSRGLPPGSPVTLLTQQHNMTYYNIYLWECNMFNGSCNTFQLKKMSFKCALRSKLLW